MATAKVALDSARTYLNDNSKQIWTDAVLLPYLKEAFRDLHLVLYLNGIPVIKEKSTIISVTAGSLDLGSNQPLDLIEPIWIKERSAGSSEGWASMDEKDFEPDVTPTTNLVYWTWREERLLFVGATSNREIMLRYWKGLTAPTSEESLLGFILAENFLGPQTAQYASRSVGSGSLADECLSAAREKLGMIIQANVKGMQRMASRRIPYRRANTRLLII